jgi:hypothetical protein
MRIFKNVFILFFYHLFATCVALGQVQLLFSCRPHRRRLTDWFGKLQLELHRFQQYFTLPTVPHPGSCVEIKPTSVHIFPKHTHHMLKNSVNFSNRMAQHQISWPSSTTKFHMPGLIHI